MDKSPDLEGLHRWFLENRRDLARTIAYMEKGRRPDGYSHRILAIPSRDRLTRVLRYLLDEAEFLSPFGVRSLSRIHGEQPYVFRDSSNGQTYTVEYAPGESRTALFGGNSNWRGPIWFPLNYLLIEALERYHHFYGDDFKVECPTGSGKMANLNQVARIIAERLKQIFMCDKKGRRPLNGDDPRYIGDPHWRDLVLFYEYFHGDTGRGIGASHQTGWTALIARMLRDR